MFIFSYPIWKETQINIVLTVLKSVSSHTLAKIFSSKALTQQRFSTDKLFNVTEEPVSDLHSLSALLQRLEDDPTHTVIRGALTEGQSSTVSRNRETFTATPRQWCMIDIDGLAWNGDLSDQQAMLSYATSQLSAEFHPADCWYHSSSSMGIKAGINVHQWFWLDRPCSDNELKVWLSGCPVDMRMFSPIQIHLTANPRFIDVAIDPNPDRSGLFEAGSGISTVTVPSDLAFRSSVASTSSKHRTSGKSGLLNPSEIERDPDTGLAIDGREQLMSLLSNKVMRDLVTANYTPTEEEVTTALWSCFCEEAVVSIISQRSAWTIADATSKAKARLQKLESGTYDFVSRSDRTTLVAGSGKVDRPKLIGAEDARSELNSILSGLFEDLSEGANPRAAIRLTMGTGKTKQTVAHLKTYLADKYSQKIEAYVPRHDLADEYADKLRHRHS